MRQCRVASSWFENFPNRGGQPTAGNLGFSLTRSAAPGVPQASRPGSTAQREGVDESPAWVA